jgi:hypothetical protein
MSQSLVRNLLHLVYSTKHRRPTIGESVQEGLWAYQAGIFRKWDSPALVIGGVEDHVHALFLLSRNHALKKVVEEVKTGSSNVLPLLGNDDLEASNDDPNGSQKKSGARRDSLPRRPEPRTTADRLPKRAGLTPSIELFFPGITPTCSLKAALRGRLESPSTTRSLTDAGPTKTTPASVLENWARSLDM